MDKESTILTFMSSLNISREEAEQLYEDDNADYIGEEGEKMTAAAKQTQHREKSSNERKKVTKQRKVDNDKLFLFNLVKALLQGAQGNNTISDLSAKTETELKFNYNGYAYTWKLTKHKNPK